MKKEQLPLYCLLAAGLMLLTCGVTAYLVPDVPLVWQITGGLGIVLIGAYVYLAWEGLVRILSKKTTLYGLNSALMVCVLLAIVVVINLIIVKYDVKADFTKDKVHTFSDQTVKVLKGLKDDVKLRAFIVAMQQPQFQEILERYAYYSKHIKKELVDVHKEPMEVRRLEIKREGTIVVESGDRSEKVENLMGPDDPKLEEKISNAIIRVVKGGKRKLAFTTGHGEFLVSDNGRLGLSQIKEILSSSRYDVQEITLLDKEKIPDDIEILVIPAPSKPFMEHELKALEAYLDKGGKALFMMKPDSTPTLKPLLEKRGVDWRQGKAVFEMNILQKLLGGGPAMPIVTQYDRSHEITQTMQQLTVFHVASPVEKAKDAPKDLTVTSLFSSSPASLEGALDGDKIKVDQKKDRKGPLSLALAVAGKIASSKAETKEKQPAENESKAPEKQYRMVVVGDAEFIDNQFRQNGLNTDLFQNMLSWLAQEEDLISIRPKPSDMSSLEITEGRYRVVNLASVFFAPMLMFLSGIWVWFVRRRK